MSEMKISPTEIAAGETTFSFWNPLAWPQRTLYHFTDAGGLLGILKTRKIWASHHSALNDASEKRYGLSLAARILKDTCREGVDRHGILNIVLGMLSEGLSTQSRHSEREKAVGRAAFSSFANRGEFVACFCESSDHSLHWMHYGRSGRGYAIATTLSCPDPPVSRDRATWALRPVIYDQEEQRGVVREAVVRLRLGLEELKSEPVDQFNEAVRFALALGKLVIGMKHPSFSAEKEWRLLRYDHSPGEKINLRPRAGMVVPYAEFHLGDEWAPERVLLGHQLTTAHEDTVEYALRTFEMKSRVERSQVPVQDPL